MNKSIVTLWDMADNAAIVKEALFFLDPRHALIAAVMQYKGDYNTADYPANLPEIYASKMVKDRLCYDISDDLILTAQNL